jgi:superfamily II DNA or RNA helicase
LYGGTPATNEKLCFPRKIGQTTTLLSDIINRAVKQFSGDKRLLLTLATGTGKTKIGADRI